MSGANRNTAARVWLTTRTVVRNYVIDARLAASGTGEVYLAKDRTSKREVALKILPAPPHCKPAQLAALAQQMNSQSMPRHPFICETYEVDVTEDGKLFIASEYVSGQSLDVLLQARVSLDTEKIAEQIAVALQAAHEGGRLHTDLKFSNVMLTPSGNVKVLDFGLTKYRQLCQQNEADSEPLAGLQPSSVRHFAPEHVNGITYTAQTDLFSLGAMLYEMLAGVAPFIGETPLQVCAAIVWKKPQPLLELVHGAAPALCASIDKLIEKDQSRRTSSAQALLAELRQPLVDATLSAQNHVAQARQSIQSFFVTDDGQLVAGFGKGLCQFLCNDAAKYAVISMTVLGACYTLFSFLTLIGLKS